MLTPESGLTCSSSFIMDILPIRFSPGNLAIRYGRRVRLDTAVPKRVSSRPTIAELPSLLSLSLAGMVKVKDPDRRPRCERTERKFRKTRGHTYQVARWLPGQHGLSNHEEGVGASGRRPTSSRFSPWLAEPSPPRASHVHTLAGAWEKGSFQQPHQTVHTARRTFDPSMGSRYLASRDESLVLCPESSLWVDVDAFEEAARSARRSREPAVYRAALDLYTGELLPTDRYEEWAEEPRLRLQETISRYCWGSPTSMRSSRTMTPPSRR